MKNNYCCFCPGDNHKYCTRKLCIFDDDLWTVEMNIQKILKRLDEVQYSLQTYYKRWNTNIDVLYLEKMNRMLLEDLDRQKEILNYLLK